MRGKVLAPADPAEPGWNHPRICGEKCPHQSFQSMHQGSPPHVRGKGWNVCQVWVSPGITPACAGKSQFVHLFSPPVRDHPRMCGEKKSAQLRKPKHLGSPPHVRGKVPNMGGICVAIGITPACAGKSPRRTLCNSASRDHPRMCGEKLPGFGHDPGDQGSPPHMRGKVPHLLLGAGEMGITPACAGKSTRRGMRSGRVRDHPRMCGEKA